MIDAPGGYILTVTAPDGCTSTAVAVVNEDTTQPNVFAGGGFMACSEDSIQLAGDASLPITDWSWQGPNGFTSNIQNPFAYEPGGYILTVTAENGCTKAAQGNVILNGDVPTISVSGMTELDCENDTLTLSGSTSTAGANFIWSGPNGFESFENNIEIDLPGTYIFTATSADDCVSSAQLVITQDTISPDISAIGGTITCDIPEVNLTAISTTPNLIFQWQSSNGFSSIDSTINTSESGIYELTATAENGCTAQTEIQILEDTTLPDISADGGTIDCNNDSIQIVGNSQTSNVSFEWSGPNSFLSDAPSPIVSESGNYTLTLTAENGCISDSTVMVDLDLTEPDVNATGGILDCIQTDIQIQGSSLTTNLDWNWTGPNAFQSDLQNPMVSDSGLYILIVSAENGCTNSAQTAVLLDAELPDISADGGLLNCTNPEIELIGNSNTINVIYSWTGPNNFQSDLQNPMIDLGGNYTLTVTAENGCTETETVLAEEDFEIPDINATGDTITCDNPIISVLGNSTANILIWGWTGPNAFQSDLQNPNTNEEGTYNLTITAENGCTNTTSTDVTENADFPIFSIEGDTLTCANLSFPFVVNSMTANVEFSWTGPNAFSSIEQNPVISDSGNYVLTVTAENGCSKEASYFVAENKQAPDIQTEDAELNCAVLEVELSGNSSNNNLIYEWSNSGGILSNNPNILVNQVGIYEVLVTAENGCTASANAEVILNNTPPIVNTINGTLTCAINEIQIFADSNDPNSTFEWTGPNMFNSTNQNPNVTEPGIYSLTVTGENHCQTTINSTEVFEDRTPPIVSVAIPDNLNCANETVTLDATGSDSGMDFQFQWTTADGNIRDFENTLQPMVDQPGVYTLTILNTQNGCEDSTGASVIYEEIGLENAEVSVNAPACWGDENGSIEITSVSGGIEPYLYSLNGGEFSDLNEFNPLPSGLYDLQIQDVNGCEWFSEIVIPAAQPILFSVNPTPDNLNIVLGDSIELSLNVSVGNDKVDSIIWSPNIHGSPSNPILKPIKTTQYSIEILTQNGCQTKTDFTVFVDTNRPVFVPNAFSPNGDGVNDILTVFGGPQIAKINQFSVFDRWGQTVFEAANFNPNETGIGWDGKFRGEIRNPDVYVWFAEVEFIDGKNGNV